MTIYRKIYESHFGPIPKDEHGRSYEIHHIDGNHNNNDINNLKCVTCQEHYDIHYSQGDWFACWAISERINLSGEEISTLARLNANRRVAEGTHNFQDSEFQREKALRMVREGTNAFVGGDVQREHNQRRVKDGTHHLLKRPDGSSHSSDKVKNGTHNFLGGEVSRKTTKDRIEKGTHNFQRQEGVDHPSTSQKWYCNTCQRAGSNAGAKGKYHKGHDVIVIK